MSTLDDTLKPEAPVVQRVEVFTGTGRRRRFSDDDKARMIEETLAPGAVVSEVAPSAWDHQSIGNNWRMTELQAAIGLRQLAKLPAWTQARTANAHLLASCLAPYPCVQITPLRSGYEHA